MDNSFEIIFRLILAIILGGVIGMERESRHRPAGFRTHILVCLGSATIMVMSELMFTKYQAKFGITFDPTRIAAQVVSGIGFLGAGTIIHYGSNVRGLTTAASLWAMSAIGLAVGAGFYFLAIAAVIIICIVLFSFGKISQRMAESGNLIELMIQLVNKPKTIGAINMRLSLLNGKILDMDFINTNLSPTGESKAEFIKLRMLVKLEDGASVTTLIKSIEDVNGVVNVERL